MLKKIELAVVIFQQRKLQVQSFPLPNIFFKKSIHILHKFFQKIEEGETLPKSFYEPSIYARNERLV